MIMIDKVTMHNQMLQALHDYISKLAYNMLFVIADQNKDLCMFAYITLNLLWHN